MGQICSTTNEVVTDDPKKTEGGEDYTPEPGNKQEPRRTPSKPHLDPKSSHRQPQEAQKLTIGDLTEQNLRSHTKQHAYNKRKSIVEILDDAADANGTEVEREESVHSVHSLRSNSATTINYSEAGLQPYCPQGISVVNDGGEAANSLAHASSTRHHRDKSRGSVSRSNSTRSPRRARRTSRTPPVATLHETDEEHKHKIDDAEVSYKKSRSSRQNSAGVKKIQHNNYNDKGIRESRSSLRNHKKNKSCERNIR